VKNSHIEILQIFDPNKNDDAGGCGGDDKQLIFLWDLMFRPKMLSTGLCCMLCMSCVVNNYELNNDAPRMLNPVEIVPIKNVPSSWLCPWRYY
jgi:hypothetical protein